MAIENIKFENGLKVKFDTKNIIYEGTQSKVYRGEYYDEKSGEFVECIIKQIENDDFNEIEYDIQKEIGITIGGGKSGDYTYIVSPDLGKSVLTLPTIASPDNDDAGSVVAASSSSYNSSSGSNKSRASKKKSKAAVKQSRKELTPTYDDPEIDILGTCDMFDGMLEALDDFHKKGYGHYDVKPENFLRDKHGKFRLIDFGESVKFGDHKKPKGPRGTLSYISPELMAVNRFGKNKLTYKGEFSPKHDIYSLGKAFQAIAKDQIESLNPNMYKNLPPNKIYVNDAEKTVFKMHTRLVTAHLGRINASTLVRDKVFYNSHHNPKLEAVNQLLGIMRQMTENKSKNIPEIKELRKLIAKVRSNYELSLDNKDSSSYSRTHRRRHSNSISSSSNTIGRGMAVLFGGLSNSDSGLSNTTARGIVALFDRRSNSVSSNNSNSLYSEETRRIRKGKGPAAPGRSDRGRGS